MKTKTAKQTKAGRPGRPTGPGDKVLENVLQEVTVQPVTEQLEEWVSIPCPYCGEDFEIHVTSEDEGQTKDEDCEVCCRPMSITIQIEDGEFAIEAQRA